MHAELFKGQLIFVDTEKGQIQLMDKINNQVIYLGIDADTSHEMCGWENQMGDDVDVVVIDGKTKSVYSSPVEEE